jgi:hypothetical protein
VAKNTGAISMNTKRLKAEKMERKVLETARVVTEQERLLGSANWRKQKIEELKRRIEKLMRKSVHTSDEIIDLNRSRKRNGFLPRMHRMWRDHARLSLIATKKKIENLREQIGWYK